MKNYPFIPKSNKKIKVGDYWLMKLSDDSFSVGVVIDIPPNDLKLTREIIIGLLDWNENHEPKMIDIKNSEFITQGHAHIKTIIYTGNEIVGNLNLTDLNITPKTMIDTYGANSSEYYLMKGYSKIRVSSIKDDNEYETCGYWGFDYIKEIAENVIVRNDKNWL
jgi:hypothetical protein